MNLSKTVLLTRNVPDFECSCAVVSNWKYCTFKSGETHHAQGIVVILGSHQGGIRIFDAVDNELSEDDARFGSCNWAATKGDPQMQLRVSLKGHDGKINAASVGVEGNIAATCGEDKKVLVWDLKHDKILHSLKGHSAKVKCCSLASDGSILVSGDGGGKLMIWDVQKGTRMGTFGEFRTVTEEQVKAMSLAELRDMERERALVVNHTDVVSCCALDHELPSNQMLSGSWDTTLMVCGPGGSPEGAVVEMAATRRVGPVGGFFGKGREGGGGGVS